MHIISFATEDSNWDRPRMGIIIADGRVDLGYRLDCERLFDEADRPTNTLAWFDMDGKWFQRSREVAIALGKDPKALEEAKGKGWLVESDDAYWFAPVPRPGKL